MANPQVPVEGNEGFLDSAMTFAGDTAASVGSAISDTASYLGDKAESLFSTTKTALEDVQAGKFDIMSPLFNEAERKALTPKYVPTQEERDFGKEINSVSGWQMAKDIFSGVKKMGEEKIGGSAISKNLIPGVTEKQFQENVGTIQSEVFKYQKAMDDISSSDPKFQAYRDFSDSVYQNYLKTRGVSTVTDQNDYTTFERDQLGKLNAIDQQKILQQKANLNFTLSDLNKSKEENQQKMRDYINQNVRPDGEKTGEQVYQDIQDRDSEFLKDNKFLNVTQKIRDNAAADVEGKLAQDAKLLVGAGESYNELKDVVIDNKAASDQFYYTILDMKDIPDNEKLALKFKEGADVAAKYGVDFVRTYGQLKNNIEYKGMSEVEKREKIAKVTYDRLSPEEKSTWRQQESTITAINQLENIKQFKERAENINPMAFLDGMAVVGSTIQSWVDRVYDSEKDEIPHYVRQETRGLLYSDEGNLKKLASMVVYNTDALVSLAATMKVMDLPIKGVNKAVDGLVKSVDKGLFMNGIKVGFTEGKLSIIPTAMKGLSESMISGAATDPIFDNLMVQAPSKTTEEFNNLTNVLFDATLFTGGKGVTYGMKGAKDLYNNTANSIMWKFMNGEEKEAVQDMIPVFKSKFGKDFSNEQMAGIMKDGEQVYRSMYNATDIDNTFKKPGELFKFIKTNIDGMDANDIDEVLTANGLGIRRNVFFGMPKEDFAQLSNLYPIKNMDAKTDADIQRQIFATREIRNKMDEISLFAEGKGLYNETKLDSTTINKSPEYRADLANVKRQINDINLMNDNELTQEALEKLDDAVFDMQSKYGISENQGYITLIDTGNTKNEFKIAIKDFKTLDGMEGKNFMDLIKEGKVKVNEGTDKIQKGVYQIKNQLDVASTKYRNNFMRSINNDIQAFITSPERAQYNIPQSQIYLGIDTLLKKGEVKFDYLRQVRGADEIKKEMKSLSDFIQAKYEVFFGKDFTGPAHLINVEPSPAKNLIRPAKDVIDEMNARPGYFNLSYGYFHSNEADIDNGIYSGAFYVTLGKEIQQQDVFKKKLSGIDDKEKYRFPLYTNSTGAIIQNIMKFSMDKTAIPNIIAGIQKSAVIESTNIVPNLFKEGKLNRIEVDSIVTDALKGTGKIDPQLREFIFNVFKDTHESQSIMVTPMIYNLAYKYQEYKPLIDSLFRQFDIQKNEVSLIEAFANIILSPTLYDNIVDKVVKNSNNDKLLENLRPGVEREWEDFTDKLIDQKARTQIQIDNIRAFIKSTKDYPTRKDLEETLRLEVEKINKIDKVLEVARYKETFISSKEDIMMRNLNQKTVIAQTNNFAFASLVAQKAPATIGDIELQIADTLKLRGKIYTMPESDKELIRGFIKDIKESDTLESQKALLDREFKEGPVREVADQIKSAIMAKNNEFVVVDRDGVFDMINNFNNSVYDHEYIKANNPISKSFGAFSNNSNTGQDQAVNVAILGRYNAPTDMNANDLYHLGGKYKDESGKTFKEMIDGLFASSKDGELVKADKKSYREFLRSVIESSGIKIKTDKVDDFTHDLLEQSLKDGDLLRKFKAIARRKKSKADINLSIVDMDKFTKNINIKPEQYNENILQLDKMIDTGMKVQFMRGMKTNGFKHLNIAKQGEYLSIGRAFKKYFDETFAKGEDVIQSAMFTDAEIYKYVLGIVNGTLKDVKEGDPRGTPGTDFLHLKAKRSDIMKQLGMSNGYFLVGNFGDKNTVFTAYKPNINLTIKKDSGLIAQDLFEIEYALKNGYYNHTGKDKYTWDDFVNGIQGKTFTSYSDFAEYMKEHPAHILDTQAIRKRESANMSNYSTFEGYKEPLTTYILKKVVDTPTYLTPYLDARGELKVLSDADLQDIMAKGGPEITYYLDKIKSDYPDSYEVKSQSFLDLYLNNDLHDGTSFVSNNLGKIRAEIQGAKETARQFKDHFYGDLPDGRVLGKTLFNLGEIRMDGQVMNNIAAIGESSLKLKAGYVKYDPKDFKEMIIDGQVHTVIGEVKGTDTSFFKNATSDSYKESVDTTMSDSIKAKLEFIYADAIEAFQKQSIKAAYEKTIGSLSDFNVNINSFDSIAIMISKMVSIAQAGAGTNSIIASKMKAFLSEIDEVINKPKDEGQKVFIRESSFDISPEEVIMSRKSPLVQQMLKEISEDIQKVKDDFNLTDSEKDSQIKNLEANLYTIGYRYPVPSKYNLGLYKVRMAEDMPGWKQVGPDQVVLNPLSTYLKLEGDNDGDHVFFLSAKGDMGNVLANSILGQDPKNNALQFLRGNPEYKNDFIIADQITKADVSAEKISLTDSRAVALEAKESIGFVSATIRTLGTFKQMLDKYSSMKGEERTAYGKTELSFYDKDYDNGFTKDMKPRAPGRIIGIKVSDLYDRFSGIELGRDYDAFSSSILQKTLDFGNSGATVFNKDWYYDMMAKAQFNPDNIPEDYKYFVSELSKGYKNLKLTSYEIGTMAKIIKKLETGKALSEFEESSMNNFRALTGSKRELIADFIKNYGPFVNAMNNQYELKFLIDDIDVGLENEMLNEIKKTVKDTRGYNNLEIWKDDKITLTAKVKEILNKSEGALKSYVNFIESTYTQKGLTSKEFELKKAKMYSNQEFKNLSREDRNSAAIYAYLLGEHKIVNFLQGPEYIDYFMKADENLVKKGVEVGAQIELPDTIDFRTFTDEQITSAIDRLENDLLKETDQENFDVNEYTKEKLEEIKSIKNFVEGASLNEKNTLTQNVTEASTPMPEEVQYNFPEIDYDTIDRSPQSINEIVSIYKDYTSLAQDGLKVTMQSLFNKYAPRFLAVYDTVRGFMNWDVTVQLANEFHVLEMGDRWLGEKDSIFHQVKRSGLNTLQSEDLVRKVERSLLGNQAGKFTVEDIDTAVKNIKIAFKDTPAVGLLDQEQFIKRLELYQERVILPVANRLNALQDYYKVDILKKYGDVNFSIVTDTLEAHKGNAQLALKIHGIKDREAFMKMLQLNSDSLGGEIWEGTKRTMARTVYNNPTNAIDTVMNFVQSVHYQMTYGTMSTLFTQNNIIAGLSQILPNYVELRSNILRNRDSLVESLAILKDYKLGMAEDVIQFGTGHGKNLQENRFDEFIGTLTKKSIEGASAALGVNRNTAKRAGELLDAFVSNMLGFNDYPLEQLRKLTAVQTVMQKLGIKDKKALDKLMDEGGRAFRDSFESKVIIEFANTGGGVVSSSNIARGTVFDHANEYFDNFLTHFAVKSFGYLMGWSYHKVAQLIEKESALFTGVKLLVQGDTGAFKVHLDDFFRYNTMVAQQIAMTTGLFMKFQKYERDNEDRMDFNAFQSSFNNVFVSMEILFGKALNAWESADEMGGTTGDKTQYTLYTIVDKMFRLFRQPAFLSTAYDRYRSQDILGKADMFEAFQYAMEQHYTTYMRFQGMEALNDYYSTIASKGNMGVLGTGGTTLEDEIFNDLWVNKDFAAWKEKGSISKFLGSFAGMMKTDDSSLGFNVSIDLAKQMRERIMTDEYLSRLVKGGQIGGGNLDYNLSRIVGKLGAPMDDEEQISVDKIWTQLSYGAYQYLDAKGNRIKRSGEQIDETKMQDILEGQITMALKKTGITMEELITMNPRTSPNLLKTMAVLDLNSNLKTPLVLYTILSMKEKAIQKQMKERSGKVGAAGYKELSTEQTNQIRKDLMLGYQEYFNLDNTIVNNVIERDIRMHNKDFLAKFDKIANFKNVANDMFNLIKADHLVNNIMKTEKDVTSVSKLQTRYALAMRGLNVGTETGVEVALKFMNDVNNLPYMDNKSKLAHQAAILYGLNKTQYDVLKDNKKFQELTVQSQKQLTNWMYKVSADTLDYDSKNAVTELNSDAGHRIATKHFNPKFKSPAMSGQRPNFSKQFEPTRGFLPGKQHFVSDSPNQFLQAASDFRPQTMGINQSRFPIMQHYSRLIVENAYYGYKSKGIIPSYIVEPKVDLKQKKYINLKKPSKAAGKKQGGGSYKVPKKVSGGAWAGLPLSNIQK